MPRQPPDEIDRRIGHAIRTYRRLRNLTQAELGAAIGVSFQQIRKYETGRNRLPVSRLFHLSAALRVPVEVLLAAARQDSFCPSLFKLPITTDLIR